MTAVDNLLAEWLQSGALYASGSDPAVAAAFGDQATQSSQISPLLTKASAETEAARQLAFLNRPIVRETVDVAAVDLIDLYRGRCITVIAAAPGYRGAGALVFVLGGDEARDRGVTTLDVLRRL